MDGTAHMRGDILNEQFGTVQSMGLSAKIVHRDHAWYEWGRCFFRQMDDDGSRTWRWSQWCCSERNLGLVRRGDRFFSREILVA
jgi:hypothetical protein